MRTFVLHHVVLFVLATILILGASLMVWQVITSDPLTGLVTTTVTRGTVEQIVSVSGITKAAGTANLAFPTPGVVSKIYVREGDEIAAGTILATLGADSLVAERTSAEADVRIAQANLAELLSGDTSSNRNIQDTTVAIAAAEVDRVTKTQAQLVDNAKRTLRSSTVVARAANTSERAVAPTISGSYTCTSEGTYDITIYRSAAPSGYSYQTTGLETVTGTLSADQPLPLGDCGLLIKIPPGEQYTNSKWSVTIPNPDATMYVANKNALEAAETIAAAANAAAAEALTLATQRQIAATAAPRSEAVTRAHATVAKGLAQLARIDAALGDRVILAPFAGTVTRVDILPGETAGAAPVFTLLATGSLELTARIPEIDITSLALNQLARVLFDADQTNTHRGHVSYISPLPIQIDGVAYFEVKIILDETPTWLRGGLNADIDIITGVKENVLRVPKRYVTTTDKNTTIRTITGSIFATTTITELFEGNDGYVAIAGVAEGTTVVTP